MKTYTIIIPKGREDLCADIQKQLFKHGFRWGGRGRDSEQKVQHTNARSLTLNQCCDTGCITYSDDIFTSVDEILLINECIELLELGKLDGMTKPTVELTLDEIAEKFSIDVSQLKIKK